EKPSLIPEPGGLSLTGETLAWIACNYQKGISPQGYAVTLHASPKFSQNYWEEKPEIIIARMLAEAEPWLGSPVLQTYLHRWRYSLVSAPYHQPFEFLEKPGPIFFAGDGFVRGKIEGAALSAIAVANYLLDH
ncbi:MAG: NAD/FAD-dependent oxidoreductase, partial [Microcystaceae cyanobacterium]